MKLVVAISVAALSATALSFSQPAAAETTVIKKYDDMGGRKVVIKKHRSWDEGHSRKVVIKRGMSDPDATGSVRVKKVIRHSDY